MKKVLLVIIASLFGVLGVKAAPANISFKDDNFYNCVIDAYNNLSNEIDVTYTTSLTDEQLNKIKSLTCKQKEVKDTSGLEKLVSLTYLRLDNNELTNIDVSKNTALTHLYLYVNKLTNIDVSKNTALTNLSLGNNELTSIDVSKNTALTHLYLYVNKLTNIDVSKNIALTTLYLGNNELTNVNLSNNKVLTENTESRIYIDENLSCIKVDDISKTNVNNFMIAGYGIVADVVTDVSNILTDTNVCPYEESNKEQATEDNNTPEVKEDIEDNTSIAEEEIVENPQTGSFLSITLLSIVACLSMGIFYITKRKNKIYKI